MLRALDYLGRHASQALLIGVLLGIALPMLGRPLVPFVPVLVIGLLVAGMVRIDIAEIIAHLRRPLRLAVLVGLLMVATPLVVHGLCLALGVPQSLHVPLVLVASAAPLASSPNLAFLLRLDAALALNLMVLGTLAMPFLAPLVLAMTIGSAAAVDPWLLLPRLAIAIGVSVAIAMVVRRLLGREAVQRHGRRFDGVSAIMLVLFAFGVSTDVQAALLADPLHVFGLVAIVFAINFGLQAVYALPLRPALSAGLGLGQSAALGFAMIAGNRSMALYLAGLPTEAAREIMPFLALYQLPIFLTPLLMGPFYRWFDPRAVPKIST